MNDFCVIGSGPSAISAAVALTRRNLRVTMLDAGRTLEESRRETVVRLGAQEPEQWSDADIRLMKEGVEASASGIPLKRLYGSDFPFSTAGIRTEYVYRNAGARPSFARGGLSNVWGSGMMPFHADDIADWPTDPAELEEGYRGVLSFVPCSGAVDALSDLFPHRSPNLQAMLPSRQGEAFLRDAARVRTPGFVVGQSRLAVNGGPCRRCGMCLYGCPYELIYNSAYTLRTLRTLPHFRYEAGFEVERLVELNGAVRIEGGGQTFEAGRVLLGAGVIPSTAILLASLGDFDVPVALQDSFYFLLPLLRFRTMPDLETERLHTLAQAFIVIRDPAVCEPFVHFSVYGYNDLMVPSLKASLGAVGGLPALAGRTLVAGGYLHSRLSPALSMTVQPGRVRVESVGSPADSVAIAKRASMKLLRQSFAMRTVPLVKAMRFSPPGRGFHTGSSFPMCKERTPHSSDTEGRPYGFDRVHLIDSSCLPSIPATTITLPVMANAWRIANLAADRA